MDTIESVQTGKQPISRPRESGVTMTPAEIERFLAEWQTKGRVKGTLDWYRRGLNQLYSALPEDKCIRRGTLFKWREELIEENYAPNTVNLFVSVANTYLEYVGHREYQLPGTLKKTEELQPELTRNEYLHLLHTAKALGLEKQYLLVKLFATCDVPVQELEKVTVEAAKTGSVTVVSGGIRQRVHLPRCLCGELLAYAERQGIGSGTLFLTRQGRPMSRTYVTSQITRLCGEAKLPSEKGNPRCLHRLYMSTREGVEANIAMLVEQTLDRQLEQEQLMVGWEA